MENVAAAVAGVIRAVAPPGSGRVLLGGHDAGGYVAWHVSLPAGACVPTHLVCNNFLCAPGGFVLCLLICDMPTLAPSPASYR